MFLRETVQLCSTCNEVTPHSRRVVSLPKILAALLAALAAWCLATGEAWGVLGVGLLVIALVVLSFDLGRHWGTRCERCRGKQVARSSKTKPTLDGNTEIQLFF